MSSTQYQSFKNKETCSKRKMTRPLTTEELLACLEGSDNENITQAENISVTLFPPELDDDTDVDEVPDEENIVNVDCINLLGPGLLAQSSEIEAVNKQTGRKEIIVKGTTKGLHKETINTKKRNLDIEQHEPKRKNQKREKGKRSWEAIQFVDEQVEHSFLKIKNKIQVRPQIIEEMVISGARPIDFFKLFWPINFVETICSESENYAKYKYGDDSFRITSEDFYKFLAILLVSGYVKVPNRRMYWERSSDSYNTAISNAMPRDRFLQIFKYLHFSDNNVTDPHDRCRKIRPLLQHMSSKFEHYALPLPSVWSLDEAMEPYYGRHHFKQFIKGKPIRFGFKFWCLNNPNGYCVRFQLYEGKSERDPNMTLGSSVVKRLALGFVPDESEIFVDNYFISIPLLSEMKKHNIRITGTIRSDRIENAPLRDLKKEPRGSTHGLVDKSSNIALFRWHDNSQVTLATNRTDDLINQVSICKRYSQARKAKVTISQPSLIHEYNSGMGGVDLFDQWRGRHRINVRSRKWYWPIIRFCINASVVNSWILFRNIEPRIKQIDFLRQVVLPILAIPKPRVLMPHRTSNVLNEIRYDRLDHWPVKNSTQRRCARCHKCVTFICSKCNVGLHIDCFRAYHTR